MNSTINSNNSKFPKRWLVRTSGLLVRTSRLLALVFVMLFGGLGWYGLNVGAQNTGHTANVPVLMYHHFSQYATNDYIVRPETFALQMRALYEHGFTAITIRQLIDFVDYGYPLPDRPVVITFDDGYLSVYKYAFPVLERYGLRGTSFIIGSAVGTDTYKDTGNPTIPKFCYEQARAMAGIMCIQSHTYDMHQWAPFEVGRARENILIWPGESEVTYIETLWADHLQISADIYAELGTQVYAVAFPHGIYDDLSQSALRTLGVRVTFGTYPACNTVVVGSGESLLSLNRFNVTDCMGVREILDVVGSARG